MNERSEMLRMMCAVSYMDPRFSENILGAANEIDRLAALNAEAIRVIETALRYDDQMRPRTVAGLNAFLAKAVPSPEKED